jgi:heptosyltransferase-1
VSAGALDVLVVRLSAMGDVVHALGAIEALARAQPSWRVFVAVQRAFVPLFDGLDHLAGVIPHERRPALRGLWRTACALRARRFAVALDLQGNWKSALVARVSGAPRRIGIGGAARREPRSARLLTETVAASGVAHPADLALDVVRAVAPHARAQPSRLIATAQEQAREAAALAALGIDAELPFQALILGDPRDNRSWPATQAAHAAAQTAWPAVVVAGPAEPEGLALPPGVPLLRHAPGELRRLVALGALLARNGGRALGPDQGPTHVLAACGADVVALFGPQDPRLTAPKRVRVLLSPTAPACVPCRSRTCSHPDGPICMRFAPNEAATRS